MRKPLAPLLRHRPRRSYWHSSRLFWLKADGNDTSIPTSATGSTFPPASSKESKPTRPSYGLHRDETDALLEVYGGYNRDRLSLSEFVDFLSQADRIAEITYRTGGRTWFVISGYYRREEPSDPSLIFYAKVMFSRDLERFSAFEISYPQRYKRQMDPVVEALESSLRPPA
jgi:hypothetical protein